jgi:hypothetical protein
MGLCVASTGLTGLLVELAAKHPRQILWYMTNCGR